MKKLLSLAAFAAVAGITALPAGAVTQSGTVTVKWNVSVTANLTLASNYDSSGNQLLTAPTILLSTGTGGTGEACTAGASEVAQTVNFNTITPDAGLAKNTDCLYKNAVNAKVTTNSTSWSLGEYASTALPTGSSLCAYPNNYASFPATVTSPASATQSARATYADNTTCAAAALTIPTSASSTNLATSTAQFTATAANIGEDMALLLTPAAATAAQTVTVTYSLLAN